ncbi:hypothetical protein [Calothrix sp. NIES-3974]|uniref:hypothetical protein n=1 Tax=Calothrix sp. NIES-3974 TaxID=2005462 RepID=UPI000B62141E|nr:hypothetical protein [Calothrix sp. NIES-3974]BAZ04565.1 hypothetical protein NIES3974_12050 [Calothrix sp. NIES-3974]
MRFKQLSVIATAIALSTVTLPQTVLANPVASRSTIAQARPNNPNRPARSAGIQLTPEQQQKLVEIQNNTRSQIEKIFTAEQKRTAEARLKAGVPPRQVFAELKFTPQQQQALQQVFISSQQQIEALLTNEQKQELIRQQQQRQQQQQQR